MKFSEFFMLVALSIFVLMFCVTGCEPGVNCGKVTKKRFHPAHTVTHYHTIHGKHGTVNIPTFEHVPDKWTITIKGINEKGHEVESTIHVDSHTYHQTFIGENYGYDPNAKPEAETNKSVEHYHEPTTGPVTRAEYK